MIDPRLLDQRLKALENGTLPPQLERTLLQRMLAIGTDAQKGRIAGFGNPQNDTFYATDNVDATHALNIRYVIPSNSQRIISARLSFHLAAYRTYTSAANNPAVTTGGGSSHSHTVANHTHTTPDHDHLLFSFVNSTPLGATNREYQATQAGGSTVQLDLACPSNVDLHVASQGGGATSGSGGGQTSSAETSHTHSVTSNVTLTNGVLEAGTAAGVAIAFDGSDKTTSLGGPWSTDVVELDVLSYVQQTVDKAYHTIALTPSGLGRIEGHLQLSYFADAGLR